MQVSVTPECGVQQVKQLKQDAHSVAQVCGLGNTQEYLHSEEDLKSCNKEEDPEELYSEEDPEELYSLVVLQRKVLAVLDVQCLQDTPID